jgi:hypothetical protein
MTDLLTSDDIWEHIKDLGFENETFPDSFIEECVREFNTKIQNRYADIGHASSYTSGSISRVEQSFVGTNPQSKSDVINEPLNDVQDVVDLDEESYYQQHQQQYQQRYQVSPSWKKQESIQYTNYEKEIDEAAGDSYELDEKSRFIIESTSAEEADLSGYGDIWTINGRPNLKAKSKPTMISSSPGANATATTVETPSTSFIYLNPKYQNSQPSINSKPSPSSFLPDPYVLTSGKDGLYDTDESHHLSSTFTSPSRGMDAITKERSPVEELSI